MMQIKGKTGSATQKHLMKALGGGVKAGDPTLARAMMGMPSLQPKKTGPAGPVINPYLEPTIQAKTKDSKTHTLQQTDVVDDKGSDSDSDFDDSDEDTGLDAIRQKRLLQLREANDKLTRFHRLGHGEYREISEDAFLKEVTESKFVVCHFFHNDFPRCRIFDRHLGELSKVKKHLPTKFVKMDADKAKFFTAKLNIKVMPTLCMFKDGVCIDRILGFEELGSCDDFAQRVLERRLSVAGVILPPGITDEEERSEGPKNSIRSKTLVNDFDMLDEL